MAGRAGVPQVNDHGAERCAGKEAAATLRTVARAFAVFETLADDRRSLSLTDIALATDLSPATTLRFIRTLERLGYVRRTAERRYRLTPHALRIFAGSLRDAQPAVAAYPYLRRLARVTGATWTFAVLDGFEAVYIANAGGDDLRIGNFPSPFRIPIDKSASALAILSALPEVEATEILARYGRLRPDVAAAELAEKIASARQQGFASFQGGVTFPAYHLTEVASTLAAPVRDWTGGVLGAVAVAVPSAASQVNDHTRLLAELLQATRDLSA